MHKFNLGQWLNIVEILTGIAVLVSLIFVAIEINQNTLTTKISTYQTAIDKLDVRSYMLATNSDLHRIETLATTAREQLTEEEWSRFEHFTLPHLALWEFVNDAKLNGAFSHAQWQGFELYFQSHFCKPNSPMRVIYHDNNKIWSDPFAEHIASVEESEC